MRTAAANEAAKPSPSRRLRPGWLRRPSARDRSRWARHALDWPLVNYLEGAVWFGVVLTLGVSYYGSYDNLVDVLMALGYANATARVVPISLDAPLSVSVIGQFLLARWKSPVVKRWRLFAVTLVTAPLSLSGNALHGALRFPAHGTPVLDLRLLDFHRPEVWIRLIGAMVPAIGIILAVAVTELVLRERARLEELREAGRDDQADAQEHDLDESQEDGSQPPTPQPPRGAKRVDPRVLRLARAGRDWNAVRAATGLNEHAAKRALTAARKQLARPAQDVGMEAPGGTGREGVAA